MRPRRNSWISPSWHTAISYADTTRGARGVSAPTTSVSSTPGKPGTRTMETVADRTATAMPHPPLVPRFLRGCSTRLRAYGVPRAPTVMARAPSSLEPNALRFPEGDAPDDAARHAVRRGWLSTG